MARSRAAASASLSKIRPAPAENQVPAVALLPYASPQPPSRVARVPGSETACSLVSRLSSPPTLRPVGPADSRITLHVQPQADSLSLSIQGRRANACWQHRRRIGTPYARIAAACLKSQANCEMNVSLRGLSLPLNFCADFTASFFEVSCIHSLKLSRATLIVTRVPARCIVPVKKKKKNHGHNSVDDGQPFAAVVGQCVQH